MIHKTAGYVTAIAAIAGATWAGLTLALDDRYVRADSLKGVVSELRRDRIESQIRDVEAQIAMITLAAGYAETPEWVARRRGEKEILEQKRASLERELLGVR